MLQQKQFSNDLCLKSQNDSKNNTNNRHSDKKSNSRERVHDNSNSKTIRKPGSIPELPILRYGKSSNLDEFTREIIPYCERHYYSLLFY